MNEKRIRDVLEIEKQAQEMLVTANRDAEQLPIQADLDGRDLIEKARISAGEEAHRILEQAQSVDEAAQIMSKAQARMGEGEKLAAKNLEKAVAYVLERVSGKA